MSKKMWLVTARYKGKLHNDAQVIKLQIIVDGANRTDAWANAYGVIITTPGLSACSEEWEHETSAPVGGLGEVRFPGVEIPPPLPKWDDKKDGRNLLNHEVKHYDHGVGRIVDTGIINYMRQVQVQWLHHGGMSWVPLWELVPDPRNR